MQVRCPATTTYVSHHVINQVTDAFRQDVLHAVNEFPGNVPRMRGLLSLLHETEIELDCEWEGLAEVEGAAFTGHGTGHWTCPNCGTYNEIELEG